MEEVVPVNQENAKLLAHFHYLRQLMDDCLSFDWEDVRSTHRQVLMAIELKRLKWENTAGVKEAKALALSRIRNHRPSQLTTTQQQPESPNAQPCINYQKVSCQFQGDHFSDGLTQLHCCQYCYRKFNAQRPHPKKECRKCNRGRQRAKNAKAGATEK